MLNLHFGLARMTPRQGVGLGANTKTYQNIFKRASARVDIRLTQGGHRGHHESPCQIADFLGLRLQLCPQDLRTFISPKHCMRHEISALWFLGLEGDTKVMAFLFWKQQQIMDL